MNASDSQARLIESLLDPRVYPHPVARVERIETHISTVLLAGEFAYKIKKPLVLSFLDFSSLERRAFFCAEEVRLNRRYAAEIYLDHIAITGSPERPKLGGDGPAIEYAVRMRRFPPDRLLSDLLTRAELPLGLMNRLAEEIAAFHAGAAIAAKDTDFGSSRQVAAPVGDTLRDLAGLVLPRDRERLAELAAWNEAALTELEPQFAERRAQGLVRECHGDLHLANIALWDDRILLFDGIEFDPALRWIDVMNDLAFVLMDLDARQAAGHGHRLRSAYLERSGDYAGLGVLRFYQQYRALVRAKIAGLRARQLPPGSAEEAAQADEASDYLALAARYTQPRRPRLIITCGLSGSGKSTAAQELVDACGFVRIRSDVERKRLFGLAAEARSGAGLDQGIYGREAGERTYRLLAEHARAALRAGEQVVVDAAFLRRDQRAPFVALAARLSVPLTVLRLDAHAQVLRQRVVERLAHEADASEAGPEVLRRQQELVEWPAADEGETLCIRTGDADWREQLQRICA